MRRPCARWKQASVLSFTCSESKRSNQRMQQSRARSMRRQPPRLILLGGCAAAAASALAADAPIR